MLLAELDQDRRHLGECEASVLNHWNLSSRIEGGERTAAAEILGACRVVHEGPAFSEAGPHDSADWLTCQQDVDRERAGV